jgi:hypothetical protein
MDNNYPNLPHSHVLIWSEPSVKSREENPLDVSVVLTAAMSGTISISCVDPEGVRENAVYVDWSSCLHSALPVTDTVLRKSHH